jgi:phage gpG-like protein
MVESVSIKIKGVDALLARLTNATKDNTIRIGLSQGAAHMAGWSKKFRFVERGIRGVVRPNILSSRTGRLQGSIGFSTPNEIKKTGNTYTARIGTNVEYAARHEFGEPRRNLRARPFLKPAIENERNQKMVIDLLTVQINKALSK